MNKARMMLSMLQLFAMPMAHRGRANFKKNPLSNFNRKFARKKAKAQRKARRLQRILNR